MIANSALHLAVQHSKKDAIQWMLDNKAPGQAPGRGRPMLTLLNHEHLTPLTLAVRIAQEEHQSLVAFEVILQSAYSTRMWSFGGMEMQQNSLYQMDTFRVHNKKLHNKKLNPHYARCTPPHMTCILLLLI